MVPHLHRSPTKPFLDVSGECLIWTTRRNYHWSYDLFWGNILQETSTFNGFQLVKTMISSQFVNFFQWIPPWLGPGSKGAGLGCEPTELVRTADLSRRLPWHNWHIVAHPMNDICAYMCIFTYVIYIILYIYIYNIYIYIYTVYTLHKLHIYYCKPPASRNLAPIAPPTYHCFRL